MNLRTVVMLVALVPTLLATVQRAHGTLGETAASVTRDQRALAAVARSTTTGAAYTVQEMTSASSTVREYLSPSGVVFAVAWNGLVRPDLSVLLGSYNQEYKDALNIQQRRHGKRQAEVKTGRIVVETWGHMRDLQGRAYLPALVPEGVNLYEIR